MTQTIHRRGKRASGAAPWARLIKGLLVSMLVTLVGVAVFALLMTWVKPTDGVIRIFNQVLKLLSIALGVAAAVGRGGEGGLLRGAAVGLAYMGLGVALYALLSGQQAAFSSYLADLGMGIAGGGIVGAILSNISPKSLHP